MKTPLNQLFSERLYKQFSTLMVDQIIRGFSCDRLPAIRINTLKTDVRTVMQTLRELNVRFERIAFLKDALVIQNQNEKFFEKLDMYKNGEIYFQGISSQLPAFFLNPQPGENILDMAAAPGSKTTQMGMQMANKGHILANELNEIRYERLKYNLEKQGITIAEANLGDGTLLGEKFPNTFDRILLDAPCSAEGRISLKDQRSFSFWSEKNIRQNAKLQKKLFESAVGALKQNGYLLYSTCTLAPEENEGVVDWAIKTFKDSLKIQKIEIDFKYKLPVLTSFDGVEFSQSVKSALKAMPSQVSEGFFIALFKKA